MDFSYPWQAGFSLSDKANWKLRGVSHLIQSGFSDCTQLLVEKFSGEILISDFSFTKGYRLEMQYN